MTVNDLRALIRWADLAPSREAFWRRLWCAAKAYPAATRVNVRALCVQVGDWTPEQCADRHNWRDREETASKAVRRWNELHRPCDDPPPPDPPPDISTQLGMIRAYAKMVIKVVEETLEKHA